MILKIGLNMFGDSHISCYVAWMYLGWKNLKAWNPC